MGISTSTGDTTVNATLRGSKDKIAITSLSSKLETLLFQGLLMVILSDLYVQNNLYYFNSIPLGLQQSYPKTRRAVEFDENILVCL